MPKKDTNQLICIKIGNSYYFNGELESAAKWYTELFAMNTDLEPEYYFRYSQSLKSIGENQKANEMQQLFRQKLELLTSQ